MWSIILIKNRKRFIRYGYLKPGISSTAISNREIAKDATRGTYSLAIVIDGTKKIVGNLKSIDKKYNYNRITKSGISS